MTQQIAHRYSLTLRLAVLFALLSFLLLGLVGFMLFRGLERHWSRASIKSARCSKTPIRCS
jgi:hypothetical protein